MATFYLDPESGSDAADGTTFANRWKTLTSGATAARTAPGDTIRCIKSLDATSLGINITMTDLSPTVTLASALTANVSLCQAAMTASANVTAATSTTRRQGTVSTQLTIAAGFTTGLAGYEATGTIDLSAYQQVSFYIRQSSGTIGAASSISITLCSDAAGVTPVNTVNIPALGALNIWHKFTVNMGGALGAAIQSWGFVVNTDNGAQTFQIDNILACKAPGNDALSLTSLIGLNGGSDYYWPIRSINGTDVQLDMGSNSSAASAARGYTGTTTTATGYKQEPLNCSLETSLTSQVSWNANENGSAGNLITLSGGWNRTDMSTQTGQSYVTNAAAAGDISVLRTYWDTERMRFVGYGYLTTITANAANASMDATCQIINCRGLTIVANQDQDLALDIQIGAIIACNKVLESVIGNASGYNKIVIGPITDILGCGLFEIGDGNTCACNVDVYITKMRNITGAGINVTQSGVAGFSRVRLFVGEISACSTYGFRNQSVSSASAGAIGVICQDAITFYDTTFSGNTSGSVQMSVMNARFVRCTFADATEFVVTALEQTAGFEPQVFCDGYDGVSGAFAIEAEGWRARSEATVRHTASDIAWKVSPLSTSYINSGRQARLPIAEIPCNASALVTIKVWMRRTNTGLTASLLIPRMQLTGMTTDVRTAMTAAADTWEEITATFTPTEAGVVEVFVECYGGTTYSLYVDDITATQA